jgi:hypothetical protein
MDLLNRFNGDVATKEELINFMYDYIDSSALTKMYNGQDVSHIKNARELITEAFYSLAEIYKVKVVPDEPTNQAR